MLKESQLFYPSAGMKDWKIILEQFLDRADKFIFADTMYISSDKQTMLNLLKSIDKIEIISSDEIGSFENDIRSLDINGLKVRDIQPAYFMIKAMYGGKSKEIIFRRGFGQYALNELKNNSLKYFCHRGDSIGEGGSNVFYLGNRKSRHMPLANLFDTLISKLQNDSFIISDGSNTDFHAFKVFYQKIKNIEKNDVKNLLPYEINIKKVKLKAIEVLDMRYNHTIVWKIEKDQ